VSYASSIFISSLCVGAPAPPQPTPQRICCATPDHARNTVNTANAQADIAFAETARSQLLTLIEKLGLATGRHLLDYRFPSIFVIVRALDGWGKFRRDPNRRNALIDFERFCCALAGYPQPPSTLADRIEDALRRRRYACASAHFQAVMLRGSGDIKLKFLSPELAIAANAVLAQSP
jgi:hypothetical protein